MSIRIKSLLYCAVLLALLSCETGTEPSKTVTVVETLAPLISLPSGEYAGTQTVFIQAQEGAEIHYTLDGSDPTAESDAYSDPIVIENSLTLKALAVLNESGNSSIVTRDIIINHQLVAPLASPSGGLYGENQAIELSAAEGVSIYYTLDGSSPDSSDNLYTAPVSINSSCSLRAVAIRDGWIDSESILENTGFRNVCLHRGFHLPDVCLPVVRKS